MALVMSRFFGVLAPFIPEVDAAQGSEQRADPQTHERTHGYRSCSVISYRVMKTE